MAKATTKTTEAAEGEIMEPGQEIATTSQSGAVMSFDDDAFFGDDLNSGFEDVSSEDMTLPRYTILQGQSPQVNSRKDEYVEGAKSGMILNTASNVVFDSIPLVFAAYERRYIEWTPRDKPCPIQGLPTPTGGGLHMDYGTDDSILNECQRWEENASLWTPRGNELVVTGTWYVINPETLSTGFIAMGKTQFTSSKKLMAAIRDEKVRTQAGIRPAPLFYRAWEMSTRLREHDGNEWFVWDHRPSFRIQEHENGRAILELVKDLQATISAGDAMIDVTVGETDGQAGGRSNANPDEQRM